MKKLGYGILWILLVCACDQSEPAEPNVRIKPLMGVWKLAEIQRDNGSGKTWESVTFDAENNIQIRFDGAILDHHEKRVCCHPTALNINGAIIPVNKPLDIPGQGACVTGCIQCQVWTVSYLQEELILTGCIPSDVKKYKR